jgi:hypothetical protein
MNDNTARVARLHELAKLVLHHIDVRHEGETRTVGDDWAKEMAQIVVDLAVRPAMQCVTCEDHNLELRDLVQMQRALVDVVLDEIDLDRRNSDGKLIVDSVRLEREAVRYRQHIDGLSPALRDLFGRLLARNFYAEGYEIGGEQDFNPPEVTSPGMVYELTRDVTMTTENYNRFKAAGGVFKNTGYTVNLVSGASFDSLLDEIQAKTAQYTPEPVEPAAVATVLAPTLPQEIPVLPRFQDAPPPALMSNRQDLDKIERDVLVYGRGFGLERPDGRIEHLPAELVTIHENGKLLKTITIVGMDPGAPGQDQSAETLVQLEEGKKPRYGVRGFDFACESCGKLDGSTLDNGWYRCSACGYPGK